MTGMYFLVPTLLTVVVSLLIVRGGAIALMMTGMSFDKAKFQALSAFSGTGFTTREAERVVNNPRRRRIVSMLMVLGNAGTVTVIVTATSSFARVQEGLQIGLNLLVLVGGLGLIVIGARHAPFVRRWERFAQQGLSRLKIFEEHTVVDEILHIAEGYGVVRVRVAENSSLIGKTISDVNDHIRHAVVLGIERDNDWLPTPRTDRTVEKDD